MVLTGAPSLIFIFLLLPKICKLTMQINALGNSYYLDQVVGIPIVTRYEYIRTTKFLMYEYHGQK